jgi:tetratricopeptide (TPR) repeat protein
MAEPHHMNDAERLESAIKSEQWFEAVELGESLLRRDANNAETLRFASKANIKIGNHATALLLLQSLHEQKPENTGILIALTRAQVVLGDSEKALENFNTITADTSSISPKECHRIRLEIGDLMLRLNKFDELEDMFKEWQVQKKTAPELPASDSN